MTDKLIEALERVSQKWGERSRLSFPADAMLINLCKRELDEALAEYRAQQGSPDEHQVIAAFLERTGQYVTNDASRQAAIAEGVESRITALEARIEKLEIALKWQGIRSI